MQKVSVESLFGDLGNLTMTLDVTHVLEEMLARNRGPNPVDPDASQPPKYRVSASLEDNILDVVLTFQKDSVYCCMEWGCHLSLFDGKRWVNLRQALAAHDVVAPPSLQLRLSCVIEDGAVFFDYSKPDPTKKGWYAFAPVAMQKYQVSSGEAGSD
jgi:hypothetical protein